MKAIHQTSLGKRGFQQSMRVGIPWIGILTVWACSPVQFNFKPAGIGPATTGETPISTSTSPAVSTLTSTANTASTTGTSYGPTQVQVTRLRLLDRWGTQSVLNTIFGPSVATITQTHVQNQVSHFGGPCDFDSYYSIPQPAPSAAIIASSMETSNSECKINPALSQAATFPSSTSGRAAFMIRICDQIATVDSAIVYAMQQIVSGVSTASEVTVPPTTNQLQLMAQQFTVGMPMASDALTALQALISQIQAQKLSAFETWRFAYYVLCISPNWQAP